MKHAHSILLLTLLSVPSLQQWGPLVATVPLYGINLNARSPELSAQRWWSGEFQNEFEHWHRENFGFRSTLVRIRNEIDYRLYGKVNAPLIVMGKDGVLFGEWYLTSWAGKNGIGPKGVGEMAGKLREIQAELKRRGKTFLVALAPGKASYYPELVPAKYAAMRQPQNDGECMAAIFPAVGINSIDFNQEFIQQKGTTPFPLFGTTGIHWSNYGAAISLQKLIARVEELRRIDLPDFRIRNVSLSNELRAPDGDLGDLLNLLAHPSHRPMGVVEWEWELAEGRDTASIAVFHDSFFSQILDYGLVPNCFREIHSFYYNINVWHSSKSGLHDPWEPATEESALKAVDEADVILFISTEINYSALGCGYLKALHTHLIGHSRTQ